jgi:hypothetical protein
MAETYLWELRNPDGGSTGLEFARGKSAPTDVMLGHALPERIDLEVRDETGALVAKAERLEHGAITPMSRIVLESGSARRENVWPSQRDLGSPVILPGGEVGILKDWWNADDGSEWRWVVEFHNRI